ncbi:hypothetical protein CC80DRAFT_544158 [Byssothecium circinans]|uniref:Uncharacterized protein n=1 Tax=Byssothecium circinans TaxID=147558 RepID=A0A6A5U6I9_9PLEO|nr:hypothetical protein CC80DRAFT_544158 [Byssothecium circinans]
MKIPGNGPRVVFRTFALACASANDALVKALIVPGALPLDHKVENTSLTLACLSSGSPVVSALLDVGADVNHQDGSGKRPIEHAIDMGKNVIVELLISRGAVLKTGRYKNSYESAQKAMAAGLSTDEWKLVRSASQRKVKRRRLD